MRDKAQTLLDEKRHTETTAAHNISMRKRFLEDQRVQLYKNLKDGDDLAEAE